MVKIKKTAVFLILVAMALAILPYLINMPIVGITLKDKLRQELKVPVDFDRVNWGWWPQPSIFIHNITVAHERFKLTTHKGSLCPDWSGLIRGKSAFKVYLKQPEITVKTLKTPGPSEKTARPAQKNIVSTLLSTLVAVEVEEAKVLLPSDGFLSGLAPETDRLKFVDLDAKVKRTPDRFELVGSGDFPCVERLTADIVVKKEPFPLSNERRNHWTLDIQGKAIDLTEVRDKVLRLFGDNEDVRYICDIVRGGRATSGRYEFEGFAEDFRRLDAMAITAQTDNVEVMLPNINLPLHQVSGPVVIRQARLIGESLSATVGDSKVSNGVVDLELIGHNPVLRLALDFDAALAEIPDLLTTHFLTDKETVVAELAKINSASGRVKGHLNIAGRIDYLPVEIAVHTADGEVSYQRFHDPAGIRQGVLTFYPDHLVWQNVSGYLGPNTLHNANGALFWEDELKIDVTAADADVAPASLLTQFYSWPELSREIKPLLRAVEGRLKISGLRIKGPIGPLNGLTWQADTEMTNLRLDSPLLPEPLLIRSGRTKLKSGDFFAVDCHLDIAGSEMDMMVDMDRIARLGPDTWIDSQGTLTLQGRLIPEVAHWVKEKQWVPLEYFPRTPCRLDPMQFTFNEAGLQLEGQLITPQTNDQDITTAIDIELAKDRISINDLSIASSTEKAELQAVFTPFPKSNLYLGFMGKLSKKTADTILENNKLLADTVQGNCRIKYFFDSPTANQLSGSLLVKDMNIYVDNHVFNIFRAALSGHESHVAIDMATFAFNREKMTVAGKVALNDGEGLVADLSLQSDKLSVNNLNQMLDLFKRDSETDKAGRPVLSRPASKKMDIAGQINVDINQLVYQKEDAPPLIWKDLRGQVRMDPEIGTSININRGHICGFNTSGTLRRSPGKNAFQVATKKSNTVDFQEVLSCFGIDNRKITGRFTLDAALSGTLNNWSDGHLKLVSYDGEIQKLTIMSKLFSVINVTDMLSLSNIKNLFSSGYPYSTIKLNGTVADNQLTLSDSFVKGVGMDFFFSGTVALNTGALDLLMFVKPFGTIDAIITSIPLIGKDLGAGNQSIMFLTLKVSGDIRDPKVTLMSTTK